MDEVTRRMPTQPQPQGDVNIIKIPLLVSGILNAVSALMYLVVGVITVMFVVGCFLLPFAVLFGLLAYFEIRAYMRFGDPNYTNQEMKPHIKSIAIVEICAIIFGSLSSLVCGILIITNIDRLDD